MDNRNTVFIIDLNLYRKRIVTEKWILGRWGVYDKCVKIIKDVKEIKKQGESYMGLIFAIIGITLTIAGMIQLTTIEKATQVVTPWTIQKTISITLIVIGYIFMAAFVFSRGKYRRLFLKIWKS